jgi:ABC-type glycerol-3-phosphate transport system substrate-binding protein
MRTRGLKAAALILVILLVFGAGTLWAADKKVTITAALMCSDFLDGAQAIMDAFMQKYPDISVELTPMPGAVEEFLQPRAASKTLPDFMSINAGTFGAQLADEGLLVDLKATDAAKGTIDGLKPVFTSAKGKLFGIAGGLSTTTMIYYNKKLFAQAGITKMPQNWDEFLALCETLKKAKITPLIVGIGGDGNVSNMIWSNAFATDIIAKDPKALAKIAAGTFNFNTKEYANVYARAKLLYDKGYLIQGAVSLLYPQDGDAFLQGQAAMMWSGSWRAGGLMKSDFGTDFFPAPLNAKGTPITPILATETGFGVAEGPNKAAALKLVDFMVNGEGFYIYQNARGNVPYIKNYDKSKIKLDAKVAAFAAQLGTAKATGPLWFEFLPTEIYSKIPATYQRVLTGDITPEQAAKETDDAFRALKK